jgi:hypothetical protein
MFALFVHPIWTFWWAEGRILRRLGSLLVLAALDFLICVWAWTGVGASSAPSTSTQPMPVSTPGIGILGAVVSSDPDPKDSASVKFLRIGYRIANNSDEELEVGMCLSPKAYITGALTENPRFVSAVTSVWNTACNPVEFSKLPSGQATYYTMREQIAKADFNAIERQKGVLYFASVLYFHDENSNWTHRENECNWWAILGNGIPTMFGCAIAMGSP